MARVDATQAFAPAWDYMVQLLFRPFRLRLWLALGLAGLFAGASGGSYRVNVPAGGMNSTTPPAHGYRSPDAELAAVKAWLDSHVGLLVALAVCGFVLMLLLAWVGAVLKFVYLNQVIRKSDRIREPFAAHRSLGTSYFLWTLAFALTIILALVIIVGVPLAVGYSAGGGAVGPAIVWAVFAALALLVCAGLTGAFAEQFVLPVMYLRNLRVLEAWRQVIPLVLANAGPMAVYILMLIAIGIGSGIAALALMIPVVIAFLIPGGLLFWIGYSVWQGAGEMFTSGLIAYTAVAGTVVLCAFVYTASCAMQPIQVFKRAYSLVVLGQADPELATVPARVPPQMPPPGQPYRQG